MSASKTITKLGKIAAVASTATAIAEIIDNKAANVQIITEEFDDDNHIKEMLEYLDGMVADVQQIHKQIDEQVEMLKHLEARIDNVNSRVDHIMGGK